MSGVENRRSGCSLPVAVDNAFAVSPQSGLAWLCFLWPGRSGRRKDVKPSLETALPLCHLSYRLMRPSPPALPTFGRSPRSGSPCRLSSAPAASGMFPTLFLRIFLRLSDPYHCGPTECMCLFLPPCQRRRTSTRSTPKGLARISQNNSTGFY